jgi:hypothetical protein
MSFRQDNKLVYSNSIILVFVFLLSCILVTLVFYGLWLCLLDINYLVIYLSDIFSNMSDFTRGMIVGGMASFLGAWLGINMPMPINMHR